MDDSNIRFENVFQRVFNVQEDYLDEVNWEKDNPQANVKKIDVMKGKNKVIVNPPTGTIVSHNEPEGEVISEKESYKTVAAVIDYDRSKKGSKDADWDSLHGKKKAAKKERDYAAWEREKMKKDDPNWKHKKYHTGMHGEEVEVEELELTEDVLNEGVEFAVDYFAKSGINEDGLDLIIEEVGLDDFVEFVLDPSEDLMEERKARRASVKAKDYATVKKEVDASDAAKKAAGKGEYAKSYAKRSGETEDSTNYDDKPAAKKKAAPKKPAVKKVTVKKAAPAKKAETKKKVVASVEKAKKKQPLKPISRPGLGSKIRSAVAKGVERHKAATKKASGELKKIAKTASATAKQHSQHRKDLVSGLKATKKERKIAGGIGKAVKKAVVGEDSEYGYDKDGKSLNPDDKPIKDQTDKQIADVTFDGGGPDGGATIKGSGDEREIPTFVNLIKNKYRARGILVAHKESDWRKELSEKKSETLATEAKVDTDALGEDYYRGTGEKVQARTKKWMDKKGMKGAPGLDAMKARTAEHEAKRGVKEDYYDSAVAVSKAASKGNKPKVSLKDRIKSVAKKAITSTSRAAGKAVKVKADIQAAPGKAKEKVKSYVDKAKGVAQAGYESGRGPVKRTTVYRGAGAGRKEKIGEETIQESEKVAQGAMKRAKELAQKRRNKGYKEKGYNAYRPGKNERAGYNLASAARSSDSDLETQRTKKKKPAGTDTSQIGHYKKRDEKVTVGKRGKPLKQPKYKLSLGQRVDHHSNKAWERRDPKKNPKHTANEGYQRDPEQQEKERKTSKQSDPSKDNFTGISGSIATIMKQNAAMKKAAAKKVKESVYDDPEFGKSVAKARKLSLSKDPKDQKKGREIDKANTKKMVGEAKVDKGRSDYGKATIRNWRHSGPSTVEPAMFDPENKRGKTIDKRRAEHKARRGVKGAKVPTYNKEEVVTELNRYGKETGKATGSLNKRAGTPVKKGGNTDDKALTFVRKMIRKETGKPEGQRKKIKGEKGRVQYGDRKFSPADSIAKRRASKAAADAAMRDTRGT